MTARERRLAESVRAATVRLDAARARRNAYIRERAQNGANIADLARKFDLSREATYKILRQPPEPPSPPPDVVSRLNELERVRRR